MTTTAFLGPDPAVVVDGRRTAAVIQRPPSLDLGNYWFVLLVLVQSVVARRPQKAEALARWRQADCSEIVASRCSLSG